ncbi:hypothetical protein ES703_100582 [subsurface metagenome]
MPLTLHMHKDYCPVCDQVTWHIITTEGEPVCLQCHSQDREDALSCQPLCPN